MRRLEEFHLKKKLLVFVSGSGEFNSIGHELLGLSFALYKDIAEVE